MWVLKRQPGVRVRVLRSQPGVRVRVLRRLPSVSARPQKRARYEYESSEGSVIFECVTSEESPV